MDAIEAINKRASVRAYKPGLDQILHWEHY